MKEGASAGKKLEGLLRRLRPHLSPAYRRAFRELRARGMSQRQGDEPIVCFDLADPAIDAVGGRYYFSLVRDFIDAGFFPVFVAHRGTVASFGVGRVKPLLLRERLGVIGSLNELQEPFLLITDRKDAEQGAAARVVKVDYAPRIASGPQEIPFPIFVHPRLAESTALPYDYREEAVRPVRLFFGGNTAAGKYDKNRIRSYYGMMHRREMVAAAVHALPAESVHRPADAAAWLAAEEPHAFVLCETQVCPIPQPRWLEAMAKADFFLACPGVGMPLCHNLVESLAAGTVPILEYGRYLTPPLVDGVHCLAFHDEASLQAAVRRAVTMDREETLRLRRQVAAYYREHLAPGCFARLLAGGPQTDPVLLLNSYRVPR